MGKFTHHNTIFFAQDGLVHLPAIVKMREHVRHLERFFQKMSPTRKNDSTDRFDRLRSGLGTRAFNSASTPNEKIYGLQTKQFQTTKKETDQFCCSIKTVKSSVT
jgi:hypothetical protein